MRKSLWSPDEDEKLRQYVAKHGCGNWSDVAKHTGLHRCGKSCRLRWINYLRPDLKRGPFTAHEVRLVVNLHNNLGNSWSKIATHLPGRTDNDVKNFWHSYTRSRLLALQQQQQQMNSGTQDDDDDEKPCYDYVYNHCRVSKKNKEEKEHGYAHHEIQLPPLMFPPNTTSINKGGGDCKVPSINVEIVPTFQINKGKHNELPSTSSNTSMIKTNTNHSNHSPHYPRAHLPPPLEEKDNVVSPINTNTKPVMIHDQLEYHNGAECATAAIYKEVHSCITNKQISRSKLGSNAMGFYHSTSSLEAASSAVSSTSHIHDSAKSSNTQLPSAADDCSLIFSPSMQVNYVINSHVSADDAPAASFHQANCDIADSKPPEGLQSVIWRFFNQEEAEYPAASFPLLDHQRAHNHQYFSPPPLLHDHHHQKPYTSLAVSSLSDLSSEPSIEPIIQLPNANQLMNVEDAFSSSASCLQYPQAYVDLKG